jgi:hypothetical protein
MINLTPSYSSVCKKKLKFPVRVTDCVSCVCTFPTFINTCFIFLWRSCKRKCFNFYVAWRMSSSGMWRCVCLVLNDVSEERIASIFRIEKSVSEEPAWAGGCRLSHQSEITSYIRTEQGERECRPHGRQNVPPKRRLTQDLHSATSQKTTFFIVTAVKASNLTFMLHVCICITLHPPWFCRTVHV